MQKGIYFALIEKKSHIVKNWVINVILKKYIFNLFQNIKIKIQGFKWRKELLKYYLTELNKSLCIQY